MSIDQLVAEFGERRLVLTTNEIAALESSIVRWTVALAEWEVIAEEDDDAFAHKMVRDLAQLRDQARQRLAHCKKAVGRHHGFNILTAHEH